MQIQYAAQVLVAVAAILMGLEALVGLDFKRKMEPTLKSTGIKFVYLIILISGVLVGFPLLPQSLRSGGGMGMEY